MTACLSLAAVALQLAALDGNGAARTAPAVQLRTPCGPDLSAGHDRKRNWIEPGFRLHLIRATPGRPMLWLRGALRIDHGRDVRTGGGCIAAPDVKCPPRFTIEAIHATTRIRPRASIGLDLPVAGRLFLSPAVETGRRPRLTLSIGVRL